MSYDMVGTEALTTLNMLVMEYLNEFGMQPAERWKNEYSNAYEMVVRASHSENVDYQSVRTAVNRTVGVMKDIEQNLINHDLSKYFERRKKVEQINSIMHISRAYPDQAIKRLKMLRPKIEIMAA
jgi:hypothetical protein